MTLIAVVTPLFPLPDEPYRGQPIYETVRALQQYADVQVLCPITRYPSWPRSARQHLLPERNYSPAGVSAKYFGYAALPLINRPWNGPFCAQALYPHLKAVAPDLVLNYWVYPEGYAALQAAQALGVPGIVGSRGSDLRRIEDPLTRWRISKTLRSATSVLTVSEELRRRAIGLGASPERTVTILNGCDHDVFRYTDRGAARTQLRVSVDEAVVLYVGRLAQPKGVLDLIEAFSQVARERPKLRFVCVGSGPMRSSMESLAQARGLTARCRFTGEQPPAKVALWMAAADLFCLPSHSEGCPNVLIEAMSAGCPAVGTDVGGIPELLRPECGILAPAKNVPRLAEALRKGLSQPWDRPTISRLFHRTWDDVAKETYAVCQEAMDSRTRKTPRIAAGGRRIRITVVTPYYPTSATSYRGHSAFQTLRLLKDMADVQVLCPRATYPNLRWLTPKHYERVDISYKNRDLKATYFRYPAFPVITRPVNGAICEQYLLPYVRASQPDLILNYWVYPEGFSSVRVGRKLGVPVVVGAIGSDVRRITDAYVRHLIRQTLTEASGVITVSEELRQQTIALGAPPERVTTILNGCDASIFHTGDRDEARRLLGIDAAAELILYVGGLLRTKGLGELMEAFMALSRQRPNALLVMVGDGAYGGTLEARAAEAGLRHRVLLPGRLGSETVATWLWASDLFCLPSYSEGCPNAVVEALSCGRPVVASDVGGIPELVKEHSGILIPPRDSEKLRAALDAALTRTWDTDGIASASRRPWSTVAEETLAVCRAVLDSAMTRRAG